MTPGLGNAFRAACVLLTAVVVLHAKPPLLDGAVQVAGGRVVHGQVRFETCVDRHKDSTWGAAIEFRPAGQRRSRMLSAANVTRISLGAQTYAVLAPGSVADQPGRGVASTAVLFGRVLDTGAVCLLSVCEIDYQATMFQVRTHRIESLVIARRGLQSPRMVPSRPVDFIEFAAEYFGDDDSLLAVIRAAEYVQPIVDPKPGCITQIDLVSTEQVRTFVTAYNARQAAGAAIGSDTR